MGKKKLKKFKDWDPSPGERAICPVGVVRELTQSDVSAIASGKSGYFPLRIRLVNTSLIGTRDESLAIVDVFTYNEKIARWWGSSGSYPLNGLGVALRGARRYYGDSVEYRVKDV